MNNLANTYVVTFSPVNDSERISAIASSNINSLAIAGTVLHEFRGASTLGQQPNVATPVATTASLPSSGIASSLASTGNMWVAQDYPRAILIAAQPQDDGGIQTSGTAITGTTGSTWQPVGLATLGCVTAF